VQPFASLPVIERVHDASNSEVRSHNSGGVLQPAGYTID
jgi:hypothetical protein